MRILRGEYDDFEEKSYIENDDTSKPVESSYKDCLMKEHMIIKQTGISRGSHRVNTDTIRMDVTCSRKTFLLVIIVPTRTSLVLQTI